MAVELGTGIQRRLAAIQDSLRPGAGGIGWVAPENLHVTLKFLGEVPRERIAGVQEALDRVARGSPPLELRIAGLGAFPDRRRPRVVWAGIAGGWEALGRLAARVDRELAGLGFAPEARPHVGHVTLGRVRQPHSSPLLEREILARAEVPVGSLSVRDFCLVHSQLRPGGPVYTILTRFPLRGEPSTPGRERPIGRTPEPEGSG